MTDRLGRFPDEGNPDASLLKNCVTPWKPYLFHSALKSGPRPLSATSGITTRAAAPARGGKRTLVCRRAADLAVVACLLAEARHLQSPTAESRADLRKQARRLGSDPSAPADYLQRCETAARGSELS